MSQTKAQLVGGVGFSTANSLTVHNGLAVTGVVTATSFSGSGAGLVGLANTDFINAEQITVVGLVTATRFDGDVVGNITGVAATFTGNVTVGGTLTYDDVTNVDSIGVVTARSGIQFGLAGVGGSVSGTGNANFVGIVTATSLDASIAFWTLGASGTNHYTFTGPGDLSGDTDPDLQLIRGQKYIFKNRSGGHPFRIQSTPNGSAGTAYNDGVTNNNAGNGTDLIFDVPFDAPSILYYQCTSHGNMGGPIYVGSSSGDDVNVGAAVTIYASTGIVSATSYYGDGSTLSGIDASPSFSGIASGSLTNGQTVIVTTDGKVVAISGESASNATGSKVAFETDSTNSTQGHGSVYDPDENKVIIAYCNGTQSDRLEYVIGTVSSGQNISFTSAVVVDDGGVNPRLAYDTNSNKLVVAYRDPDNSNYGTARVGTVASGGGSVSWGSAVVYESAYSALNEIVFDSTNNKVVIAYMDKGNSNRGTAIVGTVSGTSISFGSAVVFETGETEDIKMVFDENTGKILIMYVDVNDSRHCKGIVATVSGTSISFGSATTFNANSSEYTTCVYFPPAQKVFCAVRNSSSNVVGNLATISGTSVSFGTAEQINAGTSSYVNQAVYHTQSEKIYFSWRQSTDTYYRIIKYKSTGSNIDFDAAGADTGYGAAAPSFGVYDPDTKQVVISFVESGTSAGTAYVASVEYTNTNLSSSNFIGISNAAYSNGVTATVQIPGAIDDAQSGLVGGNIYYVQPNGTLATSAGSISVVAGRAVSATKLLISFA